jgi:hypothetical protein
MQACDAKSPHLNALLMSFLPLVVISAACRGPSAPSQPSGFEGTWFLTGGSCGGKPAPVNAAESKLEFEGHSVTELVFEEQPECHPRDCAMLNVLACPKTPLERKVLPMSQRGEMLVLAVANGCESLYQRKKGR